MPMLLGDDPNTWQVAGAGGGIITVMLMFGKAVHYWLTRSDTREERANKIAKDAADEKRKEDREKDQSIVQVMQGVVDRLENEIQELRARHQENRQEIHDLRDRVSQLELEKANYRAQTNYYERLLEEAKVPFRRLINGESKSRPNVALPQDGGESKP